MAYDAQRAIEHPEAAGWALGALDPGDAAAFEEHLRSCDQCQAEIAEFRPVAESLPLAARRGDRSRLPRRPTIQVTAPAVLASVDLRAQPGQTGSATAQIRLYSGGYNITLTAKNLPKLGKGQFYECWYAGRTTAQPIQSSSRPGRSTPATARSTCGVPPTQPNSGSCRSPSSAPATPASTARSSSVASLEPDMTRSVTGHVSWQTGF
jgi:hypothetical protein